MSKWNTIDELRDIFIRKYTDSELSNELEKACSEEYELMRDYNGRQILELLQNVDDAYGDIKSENDASNDEVKVQITYKNNILEVGNTGTSFSKDTIERLCLGRASNKSSQNIGNKGTGFRSLLNDAEWVELYSGEFAIRFSEEFTKKLFEQYVSRDSDKFSELIFEQKKNWKKEDYDLCFPIMNCPQPINKIDSGFDTLIRVKLKETNLSKGTSVSKQLQQPFYKSLLFLPNITKIVIETTDDKKISEKIVDGNEFDVAKRTTAATKLKDGDEVLLVSPINGDETLVMQSEKDFFLRIEVSSVSEQKKAATGVRGMKLGTGDILSNIYVLTPGANEEVTVKGKKYDLNRLHIGNRDTKGTKK